MTGSGSQSACTAIHTEFPYMQYSKGLVVKGSDNFDNGCRTALLSQVPMTDVEREAAAVRAGNAMQAWYSHYKQSGDPRMLDMAYQALGLMRKLLEGRSAQYVAKLEEERGLR